MPAPTPIQIRYGGDPATLGNLAFTAGTARRQYSDYQNQLANDRAFLQNELSRRTDDTRYRNNFNLSLLGMQANERTAKAQATAMQEASGFTQRQAAQTGSVSSPSRVGQPISLVPAWEAEQREGGGGTVSFRSSEDDPPETYFFGGGKEVTRSPGGEVDPREMGGFVGPGAQTPMVTEEIRSALERLRHVQGDIPAEMSQSIKAALVNGTMSASTFGKVLSDYRATQTKTSTWSPSRSVVRAAQTKKVRMKSIDDMENPARREAAMMDFLGYDPDSSDYRRNLPKVYEHWRDLKAWVRADASATDPPNAASGGAILGSTPALAVEVADAEAALRLPSGTYIRIPSGEIRIVP